MKKIFVAIGLFFLVLILSLIRAVWEHALFVAAAISFFYGYDSSALAFAVAAFYERIWFIELAVKEQSDA